MQVQPSAADLKKAALMQAIEIQPLRPAIPGTITLTRSDIYTMPAADVRDIVALAPTVYQRQRGTDVRIAGSMPGDVLYIIDGMHIPRN
ncbi:hypothetical protein GCM10023093_25080 [Nemorincola caseinilytica]|uniref:TonB-dependent receptor plug domain-containing protein n=1 Tax=Nemorincola caseinilytica TaxID=2054315 RepID=A0ABP8NLZ9_9BACT